MYDIKTQYQQKIKSIQSIHLSSSAVLGAFITTITVNLSLPWILRKCILPRWRQQRKQRLCSCARFRKRQKQTKPFTRMDLSLHFGTRFDWTRFLVSLTQSIQMFPLRGIRYIGSSSANFKHFNNKNGWGKQTITWLSMKCECCGWDEFREVSNNTAHACKIIFK